MREHRYYVYIVSNRSRVIYVGITSAIERRMRQHREKTYGGFTAKYGCHRLVYYEVWQDVHRAIARETELKGWARAKKVALIERNNPTWEDLSAEWARPIDVYQWPSDLKPD
ncbi:MAG: GIY-YIG nuclease family protein [Acidobacteria bacterium]|nr:GIY-YIG nuclease family protein [Acidobacteriota bacterium]